MDVDFETPQDTVTVGTADFSDMLLNNITMTEVVILMCSTEAEEMGSLAEAEAMDLLQVSQEVPLSMEAP